jgi:hypothetical protein
MERIPGSDRTREKLRALMDGRSQVADERSELVRLAAQLIIEEALEGEARDALGRDYYARGALCCTDQQPVAVGPRSDIYVRRTYSGRPSSSMRFSEATAMATSVICRPPVRVRSASPITRL